MTEKAFTPDIIFIPTKLNGALKSEWQEIPSSPYDEIYVKRGKVEKEVIEKAEKFFTEKFEVEDYNDNIDVDGSPIFNYGRFIEDFISYMKG